MRNDRPTAKVAILTALLLATFLILPATAQAAPDEGCRRVEFLEAPGWVTDFVQAHDGTSVLVSDPNDQVVKRFSLHGALRETVGAEAEDFHPSGFARFGDGYLVETGMAQFIELRRSTESSSGERFSMRDLTNLRSDIRSYDLESARLGRDLTGMEPPRGAGEISRIYDWVPLAEGMIVAHADLLLPGGDWSSGIISVPIESPRSFEFLKEIPLGSTARTVAIYLRNTLSVVDGKAYALVFEDRPTVYVYDSTGGQEASFRELARLPSPYDEAPELPALGGEKGMVAIYDSLNRATMAVELHGSSGSLFLLAKEIDRAIDEVTWLVHKLQIEDGGALSIAGTIELPTKAEYVTLAPGADRWLALERGPVEGYLKQEIPSMLSLSADWIEDPATSPLREGVTAKVLCE